MLPLRLSRVYGKSSGMMTMELMRTLLLSWGEYIYGGCGDVVVVMWWRWWWWWWCMLTSERNSKRPRPESQWRSNIYVCDDRKSKYRWLDSIPYFSKTFVAGLFNLEFIVKNDSLKCGRYGLYRSDLPCQDRTVLNASLYGACYGTCWWLFQWVGFCSMFPPANASCYVTNAIDAINAMHWMSSSVGELIVRLSNSSSSDFDDKGLLFEWSTII